MNVSKSVLTVAATLCGLLCGCGGSSAGERSAPAERATRKNISLIEGVSPLYGATVPQGSVQRIGFRLRAGAEADSVVLYMGERRVAALDTAGYPYEVSAAHPTGKVLYKVVAYREGRSDSRSGEFAVLAGKAPRAVRASREECLPARPDRLYARLALARRIPVRKHGT